MANAVVKAILQGSPSTGSFPVGGVFQMWQVFNAELVNGTAVVDSIAGDSPLGFNITEFRTLALWIKAASAGVPDIKVEILSSYNDTAANYVVPNTGGTVSASIADKNPHIYALAPPIMPRLRIRVTGNAANQTDTTVTAYLYLQS